MVVEILFRIDVFRLSLLTYDGLHFLNALHVKLEICRQHRYIFPFLPGQCCLNAFGLLRNFLYPVLSYCVGWVSFKTNTNRARILRYFDFLRRPLTSRIVKYNQSKVGGHV